MLASLPLDAYIRVSRVNGRDGDSFISPDVQRESIEAWAKANGVAVNFDPSHVDLDVSGAKESRPGLDAILERIRNGQSGGIVVAKLDRLSRSAKHGLSLIHELVREQGKRVVIVGSGADAATPEGRLIIGVLLNVAEWQRDGLTASWAITTANANARGVHQGNVVGYLRENGHPLQVIPEAAPIIRQVFEMRAANASWSTLCNFLDASGLKPARAAKWSINSVSSLIRNEAYLGTATQGEHRKENAHEAIISRELFAAANAVQGSSHAKVHDHLLSGLCRCQGCRYKMRGTADRGHRYYKCRGRHGAGLCDSKAFVNAEALEAYVIAEAFKAHDVLIKSTHKSLDLDALNQAVADAEAEAQAFAINVPATSDYFAGGMQAREQAVSEARQQRDNALAVYAPEGVSLSTKLSDDWANMSVEDKRAALKGLIDYIVCVKGQVQIVWRGQSKALGTVPATGRDSGNGQTGEAASITPFAWPILTADGEQPHAL